LWDSCVRVDGSFSTIPTVRNLRGGSFFVPAETLIAVKLLKVEDIIVFTI